jgi:hypothetical protein
MPIVQQVKQNRPPYSSTRLFPDVGVPVLGHETNITINRSSQKSEVELYRICRSRKCIILVIQLRKTKSLFQLTQLNYW